QPRQYEGADDPPQLAEVVPTDAVVDRVLRQEGWGKRRGGGGEQRHDGEGCARLVRAREPSERGDAATRPPPRPIVDLDLLDRAQVASGLPDPHRPPPSPGTRARVPTREGSASTRHPRSTLPDEATRVCADSAPSRNVMRPPRAHRFRHGLRRRLRTG